MMRNVRSCLAALLLSTLLIILLVGCGGGNSGGETTPMPDKTGEISEFENSELLASSQEVNISQAIVLDARRTEDEYNTGHIPGAIFAPPSLFENKGVLLSPPELAEILGTLGITRTSKIIIYDDTAYSRGAAGRLFWILEYLGCTDVRILNGGWDRWTEYYGMGTTESTTLSAVEFKEVSDPAFTGVKDVTKDFVADHFLPEALDGYLLIDVRTDEEYLLGHIPNAIKFPYLKCFASDNTVLNFKDLKILLEDHGITLDKELVAYSTIGHRSGFFYFLCRLMGYKNISNYVGSIEDWEKASKDDPIKYQINTGPNP